MSKIIAETLNRDDVKSKIIKDAAFLDAFMGVAVGLYFVSNDRRFSFYELVVEKLSFNQKLEILEKIPYRKKYKSYECFKTIRLIQQLRNAIAHEYFFHEGQKKLTNKPWHYLLLDWPKTYASEVNKTRRQLERLTGTNEFLKFIRG